MPSEEEAKTASQKLMMAGGGGGETFFKFLTEELFPKIEGEYAMYSLICEPGVWLHNKSVQR